MKIAVSADCLHVFTSGYPVRGMMLELIRKRKEDRFVLFYVKRDINPELRPFFEEINRLPNVEVRVLPWNRKLIGLLKLLGRSDFLHLDESFDLFMNPGNQETVTDFRGKQLFCVPDLAVVKGLVSTGYDNPLFIYLYKRTLQKQLSKVDRVVSISEYTKQDMITTYPKIGIAEKTDVVYNGIDNFWFTDEYVSNEITDRFKQMSYFIWWGQISGRKNLRRLIAAYKELVREDRITTKLLLVGNIVPKEQSITDEFNEHVLHLPFQDELTLKTLVCSAKGLLFPSLYEGFGLPVIEAYSQGIPAVYSNVTSLPEIGNGYGIPIDPEDISEMKKAILTLDRLTYDSGQLKSYAEQYRYSVAANAYSRIIDSLK